MEDSSKQSYLDRLQSRFRNNPFIAWGIVLATLVTGAAALIPATQLLLRETGLLGPVRPPIHITIEPFDPRFWSTGESVKERGAQPGPAAELMNWGGGNQTLFVEIKPDTSPMPAPVVWDADGVPDLGAWLLRAVREARATRIWEVVTERDDSSGGLLFGVNVTYDAPKDAPVYVLKELGVAVRPVEPPRNGVVVRYRAEGGAEGLRTSAAVRIVPGRTHNPMDRWVANDSGVRRQDVVSYFSPGEPAFLLFSVGQAAPEPGVVAAGGAAELRAYARVLVAGKEIPIESENALYAIWIADGHVRPAGTADADLIENLRPFAFQAPGAVPAEKLVAAIGPGALRRPSAAGDGAPPSSAKAEAVPRGEIERGRREAAELARMDKAELAGNPPAASGSRAPLFLVQLGAFQDEQRAASLADEATAEGVPASVIPGTTADGKQVFRVRTRAAVPRHEAQAAADKFRTKRPELRPIVVPSES